MPVEFDGTTAVLSARVTVEEAEPLAAWLRETTAARVDLSACEHLHTAALQALLAARAVVTQPPSDAFLTRWILPLLTTEPAAVAA